MEQINLSVTLDADVTTYRQQLLSFSSAEWGPTAAGTLRTELLDPGSDTTTQHTIYSCPLILREEDYSRGPIISIRYKYALDGIRLQIAKARLLHFIGRLQADGWDTREVVRAIEHDTMVNLLNVTTHLVWAIQVQYAGGRVAAAPSPGKYSTVVLTQLLFRRLRANTLGQARG